MIAVLFVGNLKDPWVTNWGWVGGQWMCSLLFSFRNTGTEMETEGQGVHRQCVGEDKAEDTLGDTPAFKRGAEGVFGRVAARQRAQFCGWGMRWEVKKSPAGSWLACQGHFTWNGRCRVFVYQGVNPKEGSGHDR